MTCRWWCVCVWQRLWLMCWRWQGGTDMDGCAVVPRLWVVAVQVAEWHMEVRRCYALLEDRRGHPPKLQAAPKLAQ